MPEAGTERIDIEQARQQIGRGEAVAVDVRDPEEFGKAHVPGAINLPGADPEAGSKKPEEGARLMVIAADPQQAKDAASKLAEAGYEAVAVEGDMDEWLSEDFNVQPSGDPDEDTELGAS